MCETILIQELNLPSSGLRDFENDVPIPKFSPFPYRSKPAARAAESLEDDTFFRFHFLAQAAHRIILSRIRNTLFIYCECNPKSEKLCCNEGLPLRTAESENFPPPSLVHELQHQLEQWKNSLPESIRIDDSVLSSKPKTPMHAFATAILHTRYKVAKFHIGRPFL